MKKALLLTFLSAALSVTGFSQLDEAIETNWDGVTARLETCRQDSSHLYIQVVFENSGGEEVSPGKPIYFKDIYLLDPETDAKIFILQDANDRYLCGPVSDFNDNGRWWVNLPPHGRVVLWAMFPPISGDAPVVDVVVPEIFPFEGIEVVSGEFATAKTHESNLFPASAALVSTRRSSGSVSVRFRLVNETGTEVQSGALWYKDAYLFDSVNARKYPVLKDEKGVFVAEPLSDDSEGGRWWPSYMNEEGKALMYLKFQAPPDTVSSLDVVVPFLVPFLNVQLTGKGGVAEASGIEVRGLQTGIRRVLKDLAASENENEIRIQLSSEILFDFDSSQLKEAAETALGKVLQVIGEYPGNAIVVEGHTDSEGADAYNQTLSEERAAAVRTWLISAGVDAGRIQASGYGETRPVASNDTDAGRSRNRRVEITVRK